MIKKRVGAATKAWLLTGAFMGAAFGLAFGHGREPAQEAKNPNVVLLRAEKQITLEKPEVRLADITRTFSQQTGYKFTLDKKFQDDSTPYAVLLHHTPFHRALTAIGYLTRGRWEHSGVEYHLRPMTAREQATDAAHYAALCQRMAEYLSHLDLKDPSLPAGVPYNVQGFLNTMGKGDELRQEFPDSTMDAWRVTTGPNSMNLSYTIIHKGYKTESGEGHITAWGWPS